MTCAQRILIFIGRRVTLSQGPNVPKAPPSSAEAAEKPSHVKPLGGVFSPHAQYPGANYAEVLSSSRSSQELPAPSLPPEKRIEKKFIRSKSTPNKPITHPYTSAFLLVDNEGNARMDKSALREAGVKHVQVLTSGMLAARYLALQTQSEQADGHIDIIFCHPRLEDMSALQWMELIRLHPLLARLPVLCITGSADEAKLLGHMIGGFDDIIMRPYSRDDLHRALHMVEDVYDPENRGQVQESAEAFNALLKQLEGYQGEGAKAEMNFREGLRHIKEKSWDMAIQVLTRALYFKDLKGEAEYALAAAWQGNKNRDKQIYYLNEACLSFVRTQKWARARLAYTQLLQVMPHAENPFIRMAENHIRSQNYRDAAGSLVLGLELGNAEDVVTRIARACMYTENPPFTLTQIEKAFTAEELMPLVQALPTELQKLIEAHEVQMQRRREERAILKQQAHAMPVQDPVRALQRKEEEEKAAYDAASYRGKQGDVTGVIPGMPTLIDEKRSTEAVQAKNTYGVLQPLGEEEMSTDLFSRFPRLNEMAAVVKVTWKLMKGK